MKINPALQIPVSDQRTGIFSDLMVYMYYAIVQQIL